MKFKTFLFRLTCILFLNNFVYANNMCSKWLPLLSSNMIIIIPIYDSKIKKPDFDCDGIIDIEDDDMDGDGFNDIDRLSIAYDNNKSDIQVIGKGIIIRILDDDTKGIKHQRFIVEVSSGQTLLISHNIDLAPRINTLMMGNEIEFYGEYEWNKEGGIIHWTHHDPKGNHIGGWLRYDDYKYE